ncbi:glutaminyl-peptide cyclotransferase-like protein [Osmerus eperlanus]|uniref:glutaminyl-peptide cyclotransferase-like protein n=1 Tax=Osmerus eperlanus TaxID=29151 RepID=UPI002E1203C5
MLSTVRRNRPAGGCQCSVGRCNGLRMSRVRLLLICLCGMLAMALALGVSLSSFEQNDDDLIHGDDSIHFREPDLLRDKLSHKPSRPTIAQVKRLVALVKGGRLWYFHLRPMLVERLPGTKGSRMVREHIYSHLESLSAGWSLEIDTFNSPTPKGPINFSNVLAVLDPSAPRRLLLACHYDSKDIPATSKTPDGPLRRFLGASDAAVPCAMILEMVTALDIHLRGLKQQMSQVTLQLVFFDGEEAFGEWTPADSLYGSRYLADQMSRNPHPSGDKDTTLLQALDLFVLFNLIGAPDPTFISHFDDTVRWFDRLIFIEKKLHKLGLLASHPREQSYFRKDIQMGPVDDDHLPFLKKGVPVLHMIATPFPSFLHTLEDTTQHIHSATVENLIKVVVVFLAEYLGL